MVWQAVENDLRERVKELQQQVQESADGRQTVALQPGVTSLWLDNVRYIYIYIIYIYIRYHPTPVTYGIHQYGKVDRTIQHPSNIHLTIFNPYHAMAVHCLGQSTYCIEFAQAK